MKITLLEERAGQPYPERAFTAKVIKVGRDPIACHIVFDQGEWPMVSRRHAEFRQRAGCCLIADTSSRFGTFVDGQRITDPCEIHVGTRVQLGSGGPLLRVMAIEQTASAQADGRGGSFRQRTALRDAAAKTSRDPVS